MSGPSIYFHLPNISLFKIPPHNEPRVLPAPVDRNSLASPYGISPGIYNAALDVRVPLTFAMLYAVTVTALNAVNQKRGHKPWRFSQTKAFLAMVLLHNVALALYSAVTFLGMLRAVRHTWPGLFNEFGLVGAVDAMCKVNGPRGLGDAVMFNGTRNTWEVKNRLIHLDANGEPDQADVGRLWNEGLSFWGWLFYLSKFYEVLDTAIILAKGKRSSTLQTYHHAGAMVCMWAGIRYMSPPIWMFVLVNSGIHSLMYTYYALAALGIRVPQQIKRILTTLQITQFVVGALYAFLHLFISYTVPVSTPYTFVRTMASAAAVASSVATSAVSGATAAASSIVASGRLSGFLKKIAFRAAGEEGLAENVHARHAAPLDATQTDTHETTVIETRYRDDWQKVPCIDTSGQAFAIALNIAYLMPLTFLFIRFFVRSYIRRISPQSAHPTHHHALAKASRDAAKGVDREVENLGKKAEAMIADTAEKVKHAADAHGLSINPDKFENQLKNAAEKALAEGKKGLETLKPQDKPVTDRAGEMISKASRRTKANTGNTNTNMEGTDDIIRSDDHVLLPVNPDFADFKDENIDDDMESSEQILLPINPDFPDLNKEDTEEDKACDEKIMLPINPDFADL